MPLYEYECEACGQRFEVIQKYTDPSVDVCRKCGKGPARRLASSPAIQFKGSGFYITDYAQKGKSGGGESSGSGKGESKKSEGSSPSSESSSSSSEKSDSAKTDSTPSTPAPAAAPAKDSKS